MNLPDALLRPSSTDASPNASKSASRNVWSSQRQGVPDRVPQPYSTHASTIASTSSSTNASSPKLNRAQARIDLGEKFAAFSQRLRQEQAPRTGPAPSGTDAPRARPTQGTQARGGARRDAGQRPGPNAAPPPSSNANAAPPPNYSAHAAPAPNYYADYKANAAPPPDYYANYRANNAPRSDYATQHLYGAWAEHYRQQYASAYGSRGFIAGVADSISNLFARMPSMFKLRRRTESGPQQSGAQWQHPDHGGDYAAQGGYSAPQGGHYVPHCGNHAPHAGYYANNGGHYTPHCGYYAPPGNGYGPGYRDNNPGGAHGMHGASPPPPVVDQTPPSDCRHWHTVLDVPHDGATLNQIRVSYKLKAMRAHPDKGGSAAAFQELQWAHTTALKVLAARERGEHVPLPR